MTLLAEFFFTAVALFCLSFFVFLVWDQKTIKTGIYKEFAALYEQISFCCHPAEIAFITDEILDFEAQHRGEKDCAEMFSELMTYLQQKELSLPRLQIKNKKY